VADTSFVGESATLLADFKARLWVDEEYRKRNIRRTYAGAAVAVLHVLMVAVLIASQYMAVPQVIQRKIEPLQWLLLQSPSRPSQTQAPVRSQSPGYVNPEIVPRILRPQPDEENNAITDLGLALGRSLACGANNYEWLSPKMRAECQRRPWNFTYDRYGTIVLDAHPRPERQQAQEAPRPSDVQARDRNTADPCLIAKQSGTPCIHGTIFGDRR
jgi:hypothetical protein